MKFYIPDISDIIILDKNWIFTLYPETRNVKLGLKLGIVKNDKSSSYYATWIKDGVEINHRDLQTYVRNPIGYGGKYVWNYTWVVNLEKNTMLAVDRIYIRKGKDMSDFSSVTFIIKSGKYKGARFWAKLRDVNCIEFADRSNPKETLIEKIQK